MPFVISFRQLRGWAQPKRWNDHQTTQFLAARKSVLSWALLHRSVLNSICKNSRSWVTLFSFSMEAGGWAEPRRWRDHRNLQLEAPRRSVLHTFSRTVQCPLSFLSACQRQLRGWAQPRRWNDHQNAQSMAARKSVLSWALLHGAHRIAFAKNQGRVRPCLASLMEAAGLAEPGRWNDHRGPQLAAPPTSVLHTFSGTIQCPVISFSLSMTAARLGTAQKVE
jgi:hypothetical protein